MHFLNWEMSRLFSLLIVGVFFVECLEASPNKKLIGWKQSTAVIGAVLCHGQPAKVTFTNMY